MNYKLQVVGLGLLFLSMILFTVAYLTGAS